jgi:hypothetical protein
VRVCKDQRCFFLCIFRLLPGLKIGVIEICSFGNVEGSVQPAVFKMSKLSFAHLHHFSHFYQFLSISVQGSRKNVHWSSSSEWSENRHFQIWDPYLRFGIFNLFPWPTRPGSQMQKVLFSDPSPIQKAQLTICIVPSGFRNVQWKIVQKFLEHSVKSTVEVRMYSSRFHLLVVFFFVIIIILFACIGRLALCHSRPCTSGDPLGHYCLR